LGNGSACNDKEEEMKKERIVTIVILTVALSLTLCVLALAGCGSKTEEAAPVGNTGTPQGDAAQVASCQANLRTIDSAIVQYQAGTGKLPSSVQALVPNYLRSVPQEPMGGSYSISGGSAHCSLGHTY
jgi:hypothetical protein